MFFFTFFIFLISNKGRTDRPILTTLDGSNNAVRRKEIPFGVGRNENNFHLGFDFSLPVPEILIDLAEIRETHKRK